MFFHKKNLFSFSAYISIVLLLLIFQNCGSSKTFSGAVLEDDDASSEQPVDELVTNLNCYFDGEELADGESVMAFQNPTASTGDTCVYENRTCDKGNLSGSYNYSSCQLNAPAACLFNGQTISHSDSVQAFQNSTVAAGDSCVSEMRACNDGVLEGSYNFSVCTPSQYASCNLNGRTIAHNEGVKAYLSSTTAAGVTCQEELRTCSNGSLSGSYNYSACTPGQFASCSFNGQVIAHGQSTAAFQNSSVAAGSSCVQEARTCNNGVLTGSYNYSSCSVNAYAQCNFNGQNIAHGQKVKAYPYSSVAYGQPCDSVVRTCNNGSLSGSGDYASCSIATAASCNFNGKNYAHGESVTMFTSSSVAYGQSCTSQVRTCNNGVMGGTAAYDSCAVNAPNSCLFNSQTVAHGQVVTAYSSSSVPYGQSCASESRTCNDGSLSGSYAHNSCAPITPASCSFNGQPVAHGQSVTAYSSGSVGYGQSCSSVSETRTCSNGVLSGSYSGGSCTVSSPASCTFNGQSIAHGGTVTAYSASSVPNGQVCSAVSLVRTCNNGALSGSATYAHSTCTVDGLISTGVTVTVNCSINAGQVQVLTITSKDGSQKTWTLGSGEGKTVAPFTVVFTSAPTTFQAFSGGRLSAHRYSNQTAKTLNFSSEDGADNDYNDLACRFTW